MKALGKRALEHITRRDIMQLVDKAAERGPSAGNNFLRDVAAFFRWCESRDLLKHSPARGIRKPGALVVRDRVLDDAELLAVWRAADAAGGPEGAVVKLLMLTGCRRTEISHLMTSEIVGDEIRLPKERTKNNTAHTIYLTPLMQRVLTSVMSHVGGRYALTGKRTPVANSNRTKQKIKAEIAPWVFHDLRRSFASGCARIGIDPYTTERMLNHRLRGVAGVYQKYSFAANSGRRGFAGRLTSRR